MSLICWLLDHKPMRLNVWGGEAMIRWSDKQGPLLTVECCQRCYAVYWKPAAEIMEPTRRLVAKDRGAE